MYEKDTMKAFLFTLVNNTKQQTKIHVEITFGNGIFQTIVLGNICRNKYNYTLS